MDRFNVFLVDADRLFREGLKRILAEGPFDVVGQAGTIGEAEHLAYARRLDRAGAVMGNRLIQQRERVPDGAFGETRDERESFRLGRHALRRADFLEMPRQYAAFDAL